MAAVPDFQAPSPTPQAPGQAPSPTPQVLDPKRRIDVYLVPIGPDQFECYYEAPDEETVEPGEGFFARMRHKFGQQLKEAEEARHQSPKEEPKTFLGRMHRRSLRWIAERIAEQRLLWHLRTATTATLHISEDLPPDRAEAIMRESMKRDADRHRNLLIPHSLALIGSAAVALVPGPNVLGYLFTFTVVGHFLAWRGAVNALQGVAWTIVPSPALTELHRAFSLDPRARHNVIREVAHRLHMPHMARFVERMATPSS
jgi:hypothetical protein